MRTQGEVSVYKPRREVRRKQPCNTWILHFQPPDCPSSVWGVVWGSPSEEDKALCPPPGPSCFSSPPITLPSLSPLPRETGQRPSTEKAVALGTRLQRTRQAWGCGHGCTQPGAAGLRDPLGSQTPCQLDKTGLGKQTVAVPALHGVNWDPGGVNACSLAG